MGQDEALNIVETTNQGMNVPGVFWLISILTYPIRDPTVLSQMWNCDEINVDVIVGCTVVGG